MCGIFGFVSARQEAASTVLHGLTYLEYRGYDSWGIAVSHENSAVQDKAIGPISGATTTLPPSLSALGHTRWATHGGVTYANAHPHGDCSGRLALIHNGIVENHQELRSLLRLDHTFLSQTDTEVLVHLLEETLETEPDILRALITVFQQVEGLSAVAVLDARSDSVVVAKNGSPIALGWNETASYLASDPMALLDHTTQAVFLEDGQAAQLSGGSIRVVDLDSGHAVTPTIHDIATENRDSGLAGYTHFMAKEIHEQPAVLRGIADNKCADALALASMIRDARNVYLIGCGTAHHAAMSGRYMLAEIAGRLTTTAVASEMTLIQSALDSQSLVIAFSQSGETIDVLDAAREARRRGARVAALVNAAGSSLDRFADLSILLGCGPERCVLATKSYTAKLAILQMTAHALAGNVERGEALVRDAADRVETLLEEEADAHAIGTCARRIASQQHIFVLGRHRNFPPALEAALKIKEVSYLHAEGFAAGELKHGVIALVTYGTPCIVLAPDDDFRREALAAAAEVQARGAFTIGMSPRIEHEFDETLAVSGTASAPYEIAAATQMLAYELALVRGCDPDKPRNLAKSVTVK